MFKKVMVAVDFSGPSLELFKAVDDLKKMGMEELIIVHAVRLEASGMGVGAHRKKFLQKIEEHKNKMEKDGLKVKIIQPVGSPAEEIRRLSEEENADLILIGSIGEGSRFRELFLGSTVANVIRVTRKPVLIEKYRKEGKKAVRIELFPKDKTPTVVIASDFSSSSLHIFDLFLENDLGFKKVILLNIVDEGYTKEQVDSNKKAAEEKLAPWKEEFTEKGFDVEVIVEVGIPSEMISTIAKEKEAGLVAISRRGRGVINELIIGSTADPVVRRCCVPVLLLKK